MTTYTVRVVLKGSVVERYAIPNGRGGLLLRKDAGGDYPNGGRYPSLEFARNIKVVVVAFYPSAAVDILSSDGEGSPISEE